MRIFCCCFGLLVILGIDLIQFTPCAAVDVNANLTCSNPSRTISDIITEVGETLRVDTYFYEPCTLRVNTTRQNRIRLDIDRIYSLSPWSRSYQSYIVHAGVGTVFTEALDLCYIIFPTNELEIYMDQQTRFWISTEAANPDNLGSATNTPIVTDCEGLVHFDPKKEPDVNIDLICPDPECSRNSIVTEFGELLAVDTSECESCMLTVNTTRQNRIRLDIDYIYSLSRGGQSYIIHAGVGTVFTEDLTSCYIAFPTNELEIYMDRYIRFRISTEAANQDNQDSATNTFIVTDCVGLLPFDPKKEPDVNIDLICPDPWCSKNSIITEFGKLLAVDTSGCESCTLTVNTTRQNRIRLDIDYIYSRSRGGQSYIVHAGVGTVFTEDLTLCNITVPTNELEIYMDPYTRFRISTEAANQDNLDSATNTPIVTDCEGLLPFDPKKEPDVNIKLICPDLECSKNSIITEFGELFVAVDTSECESCTLAVNTTRQNRIRLDIDNIDSLSRGGQSYIVHAGVGTYFTEDLTLCYITFPTNELEIYMDQYTRFRISTEVTNQDNLDSATSTSIVTDCEGLVHFNAKKEARVNYNLICPDPRCSKKSIITDIGELLLVVDTSNCRSCTLTVNTTRQNRIRLDIDNIDSLSRGGQSAIVHDGVGTVFTEDLSPCYITFPTNELEIYMDRYTRFRISLEAANQDDLDSATNTSIVTDCVGLVHFNARVNFDLICPDLWCSKNSIITEFGELLLAVDTSGCESCTLAVNTTRQNRIRLDIDNIDSLSRGGRSYIVHDGVGTVFTEDHTSCYITFPTNELEIYMDRYTRFRISTEAANQDNQDSATNTSIVTDCLGLVHFDPKKEPDVNFKLICPDLKCSGNSIITGFGELLLAVDTSGCESCTLRVNTTRQNRIRLDIDSIYSLSRYSQSYTVHAGVGTVFTRRLTYCYITFPTNELEIYMDPYTRFRISTEAANQDNQDSATNTSIVTDCLGLLHFDPKKEPDVNLDLICSDPVCSGNSIIIEFGELPVAVYTSRCKSCMLTVNTTREKRIRLDIDNIYSQSQSYQSYTVHAGVGTVFTRRLTYCYITFPTNELKIYMDRYTRFRISTEAANQDNQDSVTNTSIVTDCVGLVHIDKVEVIKYSETEVYIESNYREICGYMTSLFDKEVRGVVPACPLNCTCNLHEEQLIALCDNKTERTLLVHELPPTNILKTLDASKRQLESIDVGEFQGLRFINRLVLNKNLLTHIKSWTFTSFHNLLILEIADNMITELESDISLAIFRLEILDLHGNQLTRFPPFLSKPFLPLNLTLNVLDMSENSLGALLPETLNYIARNLIIFILDKNNIRTLYPNTFKNFVSLQMLYLDDNQLTTILPNTFHYKLIRLHLSGNMLSQIASDIFQAQHLQAADNQLQELTISKNGITSLPQDVFCYTPNLQRLSISDNQLHDVDLKLFTNTKQLTFLNISKNSLKSVFLGTSKGNQFNFCNKSDNRSMVYLLPNLQYFDLNNNEIETIEDDLFKEMPLIETISIRGNPLKMVDKKTFGSLQNETTVLVDDPATCCFMEKSQCKPQNPKQPYLTCLRLLPYPSIRVFMWVFGVFALVGNLSVLLWRRIKPGRESIIQVLLIKNLAASDLMMGMYMLIIASADAYYQQYFPSWSSDWRNGHICKLAGILSVLSSEASVFFITLISIDRFLAIKYHNRKWRLTRRSTLTGLMCLWAITLLLSVIPVGFSGLDPDFYDVSEVCIGLPFVRAPMYLNKTSATTIQINANFPPDIPDYVTIFTQDYVDRDIFNYSTEVEFEETYTDVEEGDNPGLYFSIVLFLGINFLCFFVVAVTYTWIFIIVKKSNRRVGISRTNQEITLAIRMGAIVVTDFICWAPIIVIGILVQSAIVTIHPVAYVYIVTFLLPINSTVNPYIYTIAILLSNYSTRTRNRKRNDKNKAIHATNDIGLTRTRNVKNINEQPQKIISLANRCTEDVNKLASTSVSHQPRSPETETKSDAEKDIGQTHRTEKETKLTSTSLSHRPKSPETDVAKSDAENDLDLANGTENLPELTSTSFSYQPKKPEAETKSDAENDIGQANGTENVPELTSTSFSHQLKSPETKEAKSDAENDIGLANGTEKLHELTSTSISYQPKSPETETKSDAEKDIGPANEPENEPKLTPTSICYQPKRPETETKSDAENDIGPANEPENEPKLTPTSICYQPKSPETETKSDAENDIGPANEPENEPKLTPISFSYQPNNSDTETKSDTKNDIDLAKRRENVPELTSTSFSYQPKSPEPETKSDGKKDVDLAN